MPGLGLCAGEGKQLWARREREAGLGTWEGLESGSEAGNVTAEGPCRPLCPSRAGGGHGAGLSSASSRAGAGQLRQEQLSPCAPSQGLPEITGMASKRRENPAAEAAQRSGKADGRGGARLFRASLTSALLWALVEHTRPRAEVKKGSVIPWVTVLHIPIFLRGIPQLCPRAPRGAAGGW